MANAFYYNEQWEKAKAIMDSLINKNPDNINYRARLGCIYARLSNREEALAISKHIVDFDYKYPNEIRSNILWQARIAAILGDQEQAVKYLRDAFRIGYPLLMSLHRDMDLESLNNVHQDHKYLLLSPS